MSRNDLQSSTELRGGQAAGQGSHEPWRSASASVRSMASKSKISIERDSRESRQAGKACGALHRGLERRRDANQYARCAFPETTMDARWGAMCTWQFAEEASVLLLSTNAVSQPKRAASRAVSVCIVYTSLLQQLLEGCTSVCQIARLRSSTQQQA